AAGCGCRCRSPGCDTGFHPFTAGRRFVSPGGVGGRGAGASLRPRRPPGAPRRAEPRRLYTRTSPGAAQAPLELEVSPGPALAALGLRLRPGPAPAAPGLGLRPGPAPAAPPLYRDDRIRSRIC